VIHGGGHRCAIGALTHHAEQGFRSREPHKDAPACLCEYLLRLTNGVLEVRLREESLPRTWGYRHRSLELRIEGDGIGHRPNRNPRAGHKPEHGDRTEETITSRREFREEQVATLLATETALNSGESFSNVSVADGGALQGDPVRGKVALHATIRQYRGNGAFRPSDSPPLPIQCDEGDQDVTINRSPVSINNHTTVSITVKRNAEVGAVRAHLLAECGGVGSTNAIIDNAISHCKRHDRSTSGGEGRNGEWRGGAMCRVDHHAQSAAVHATRKLPKGSRISLPIHLRLRCIRRRRGYHTQALRQSPFNSCFKRALLSVWNLASITREHLQAVVFNRIVRCGHDHTARGTRLTSNK
jgi:hypothetical protein